MVSILTWLTKRRALHVHLLPPLQPLSTVQQAASALMSPQVYLQACIMKRSLLVLLCDLSMEMFLMNHDVGHAHFLRDEAFEASLVALI